MVVRLGGLLRPHCRRPGRSLTGLRELLGSGAGGYEFSFGTSFGGVPSPGLPERPFPRDGAASVARGAWHGRPVRKTAAGEKKRLESKGLPSGCRGARGLGHPGRRRWAAQHGLGGCEREEGFSSDDLLQVLGALEEDALGGGFTSNERDRRAPQQAFQQGF